MRRDMQTDRGKDGHTDMTKLMVAFRNVENAPKNEPAFDEINHLQTKSKLNYM
jgi:hypothetical protein